MFYPILYIRQLVYTYLEMDNQYPKLKALMEQKRAMKERKEQQAKATAVKATAAVQQHKQTAQAVEHDTLRVWVATQTARMKQAPQNAETKNGLENWKFEKVLNEF
jgi:hypothetical protein